MTDSPIPVADSAQTRALLGRMLSVRRLRLVTAGLALSAAAAAGLAVPAALGRIVDAVIGKDAGVLPVLIAIVVGAGVLHAGLTALGRLLVARLGESVLAELRQDVVSRLLRLPSRLVEHAGRGELVARAAGDARVVADVVNAVLPAFASAAFAVVVTVLGLTAINPWFAVAALMAVPVQAIALRRFLRRARPAYLAAREAQGERSQLTLESIDAGDTVRAMQVADAREERVDQAARAAVELEMRAVRVSVGFWNQLNVAEFAGLGAVLTAGFLLVGADIVTVGSATAAALYFHALFGPVGMVLGGIDELQKAAAALARMAGVLASPARPPVVQREERGAAEIELRGVGFGYEAGFRLSDVTMTIPTGATAALVGASGAGKSTVAALVLGALEPEAGSVRVGGLQPGETGSVPVPRVGLAGQEPHIFAASLADNLRLARPGATENEILAALTALDADSLAVTLPDGLDTVVGAGGHALSVVEEQQVALARLLLHDPDVLVLDEATAAAGGSDALDRAVARVSAGRTTLTIAHRLDQAERADLVFVLQDGRVVEHGTHAQLVAAGGVYARLWEAWTRR